MRSSSDTHTPAPATPHPAAPWAHAVGMGLVALAAALLGIWARPIGYLSVFWPANALLLGLMLRNARNATPACWLFAGLGFVTADLITDATLLKAVWLTLANLLGIAAGWLALRRLPPVLLAFRRRQSMLYVLGGCTLAALVSTLVGMWAGPVLFANSLGNSAALWFSSEIMNNVLILPLVLSFPDRRWADPQPQLLTRFNWPQLAPLLCLVVSEFAAYKVGGHGALAFSIPALLWCALTYGVFSTTVLGLLVGVWKTIAVALGAFVFTPAHVDEIFSLRLGLTLLSLGPLAVACSNATRNELLQRLDRAVNFDYLTDVLARGAFLRHAQRLLERCAHGSGHGAVLMLDLDHFKRVNDRFGHAGGDALLSHLCKSLSHALRPQDLFGRLGGEEFAILMPEVSRNEALKIAQRLLNATRDLQVPLGPHQIRATVSIGMVHVETLKPGQRIDELLLLADSALYQAKASGRDRIVATHFSDQQGSTNKVPKMPDFASTGSEL